MLRLRRGTVVEAGVGREQSLSVELEDGRHPAIADTTLVGRCEPGDEVIVNTAARELQLGSGGFDIVHVNLTRGLDAPQPDDRHVMKLNYSSLQHAILPLEGAATVPRVERPVAVAALHGQLSALAWAFAEAKPGARLGFVQTPGGALPGTHSRDVETLLARGLLCAHVTAGPCFGGADGEALTTIGALAWGLAEGGWDAAVCAPGPGIVGSGSVLGHGGMPALDSLHAAAALGAKVIVAPRMSDSDSRERHRGISHHTRTVLELALVDVIVALPPQAEAPGWAPRHHWQSAPADIDGFRGSGLSALTMGRTIDEDPAFFAAALAAGSLLAGSQR